MNKYTYFAILAFIASGLYLITRRTLKISEKGIALIKDAEGFSAKPYQDVAGYWTIGYGHKILETDDIYPYGEKNLITNEEAENILLRDISWAERCVNANVSAPLTQNQYDALISFVYNVGCGNFEQSMMLKLINDGDFETASEEFKRWVYSKGRYIAGLENRRTKERQTFIA